MTACVLAASVFGAMRLRANAERASRAALGVAKLEEETLELDRAVDAALVASLPSTPDDAGLAHIRDIRSEFEDALRHAMRLVDRDDRRRIDPVGTRYGAGVDVVSQRLGAGQYVAARTADQFELEPAFDALHALLGKVTDDSRAAATRERRLADEGFLAILVLTGLGVAGLAGAAGVARRRAERVITEGEALRRSEARYRALMTNGDDIIVVADPTGVVREISASVVHVLRVPPEHVIGRRLGELVHPDEVASAEAEFARSVTTGGTQNAEWRCRDAMGSWRYIDATITNLLDVPEVGAMVLNVRDVSDRRRLEDELRHRAFHDSLTGLANRALLRDRVEHAMARREPCDAALLTLDLDGFKHLNDSLGHPAGDHALAVVADRLRAASRPGDTVARLGGDEFAVLIEEAMTPDDVAALAQRLVDAIVEPFSWETHQVTVGTSVGIAFVEPGLHGADDLIRNADVALYAAKAAGPGQVRLFERSMHDAMHERFLLATELRHAIDTDQLVLHYQPVVQLATGELVGFEALVRWDHPTRGLLPPDLFIPVAEETGLIVPLGRWVLTEACRAAAAWSEHDPTLRRLHISVNVSGPQLQDPDIVDTVAAALDDTALEPRQLVLEITETALMRNVEAARACLARLKELGVHLAVDDFGTGYSSLSYLHQFPVDTIKIDKSFIDGATAGGDNTTFLQAILSLGDALHMSTHAEGIETAEQANTLQQLGCRLGQGYHYAKPLTPDAARVYLHHHSKQPAASLRA